MHTLNLHSEGLTFHKQTSYTKVWQWAPGMVRFFGCKQSEQMLSNHRLEPATADCHTHNTHRSYCTVIYLLACCQHYAGADTCFFHFTGLFITVILHFLKVKHCFIYMCTIYSIVSSFTSLFSWEDSENILAISNCKRLVFKLNICIPSWMPGNDYRHFAMLYKVWHLVYVCGCVLL